MFSLSSHRELFPLLGCLSFLACNQNKSNEIIRKSKVLWKCWCIVKNKLFSLFRSTQTAPNQTLHYWYPSRFAPFDSIHKFFSVPLFAFALRFLLLLRRMTSEKNSFNLRFPPSLPRKKEKRKNPHNGLRLLMCLFKCFYGFFSSSSRLEKLLNPLTAKFTERFSRNFVLVFLWVLHNHFSHDNCGKNSRSATW